jgi:hypothetical protein
MVGSGWHQALVLNLGDVGARHAYKLFPQVTLGKGVINNKLHLQYDTNKYKLNH